MQENLDKKIDTFCRGILHDFDLQMMSYKLILIFTFTYFYKIFFYFIYIVFDERKRTCHWFILKALQNRINYSLFCFITFPVQVIFRHDLYLT